MNPPGGNFASEAVWHTIAFKVSAFRGGFPFLGPKPTYQRAQVSNVNKKATNRKRFIFSKLLLLIIELY